MTMHRYRPIRRLPSGPTTESFLAQQVGMAGLERLVVLQRLRRELANDAHYIQLFLEGTRQAGLLRHPNVVEILEVGQEADGLYLVTEYLSAEELFSISRHERKQERAVPVAVACQIVQDLASGLAYAHAATDFDGLPLDIVHGEVNPRNVLVGYDGLSKISGFGLARANAHHVYALPDDMRLKLAYSAPERIRYESISPAADVFSLGVILYELLTGARLFRGKAPADVIKAVMEQTITPPSQVAPHLPVELDSVVMRAMARNIDARTATAEAFGDELRQAAATVGIMTDNDGVGAWMRAELSDMHRVRIAAEEQVEREALRNDLADGSDVAPMFASSAATGALGDITSTGMGSVPSGVVVHQPRRSILPWIVVALIGLLATVGTAFFLGTFGRGAASTSDTQPPPTVAGVVIHTEPGGTTVLVDGALVAQRVGEEGVFIARGESDVVTVEVSLDGFETVRQTIQMPSEGRRDLRLALDRMAAEIVNPLEAHRTDRAATPPNAPERGGRPVRGATRSTARTSEASSGDRVGGLLIHYTPASASITVDGVAVAGRSPLTVSALEPGTHTVRASAPDHATATRQVTVDADTSHEVRLELAPGAPRTATLDIVTSPSGADVIVNGRIRGMSPLRNLELEPDREYRISAQLDGHRPWSARVTPVAGQNPALMASLQPNPAAADPIAPTPAPSSRADIRVPSAMLGSASSGRSLLSSACGRCHGRTAGAIDPRRYTGDQWTRYFATGRHGRRAMLRESFTQSQLADVKAYLLTRAADVESARAAGVH